MSELETLFSLAYVQGLEIQSKKQATETALNQLRKYLKHAGSDLEDLVKVTVTFKRGESFDEMKPVFKEYFPNVYPARNTILVDEFLGKSIKLQIEGIAYKP